MYHQVTETTSSGIRWDSLSQNIQKHVKKDNLTNYQKLVLNQRKDCLVLLQHALTLTFFCTDEEVHFLKL